jgi:xylan 1,4-beta-xylosidase
MSYLYKSTLAAVLISGCSGASTTLYAQLPPQDATIVSVDFSKKIAVTTSGSYGLNGFAAVDPAVVGDDRYQKNIAYIKPGIFRLHTYNMMGDSKKTPGGWLDLENKKWDREKIKAVLDKLPPRVQLLVNIPTWPDWMVPDEDKCLKATDYQAFADFCADLVRIINVENKRHVLYWEITNEKDDVYWGAQLNNGKASRIDDLVELYLQCATAMKAVDPTILTGGPAAARPDHQDQVRKFIQGAKDQLDFVSFHQYASGSAKDSDLSIFTNAKNFGKTAAQYRDIVQEDIPQRIVPVAGDEFNISWTWETQDPRMTNYKGAVFDALALIGLVQNGATWTCAWNDCDGVYGKMQPGDYQLRPSADLYHLFNTFFIGDIAASESSQPNVIVPFAVANGNQYALALVSMRSTPQDCQVKLQPDQQFSSTTPVTLYEIGSDGFHQTATTLGALSLYHFPSSSVVIVTWEKASVAQRK